MPDNDPWPEKVIYVCSASRGITPNRAPLRHAGSVPDRLKGVLILEGIADPKTPTATEKQDVIATAVVLRKIAIDEMGLEPENVQTFKENPHRLDAWTGAMEEAAKMAGNDAAIAFNITGGTKQMTLGTLLGHRSEMPALHLVSKPNVGQVQLVRFGGQGLETAMLPFSADDTLKNFLASHGRFEIDPEKRKEVEKWRLAQMAAVGFLVGKRMGERARIIASIGRGIPTEQTRNRTWQPFIFAPKHDIGVPDTTFTFANKIEGLETSEDKIHVKTQNADRFLRCGWLETLCFKKVRDALKGTDAEVVMGLEMAALRQSRRNARKAEREIDVAVFWKDQLLCIECKSGGALFGPEEALRSSDDARVTFSGRAGAAFMALPGVNPNGDHVPDILARAADRAVVPLIGWQKFNNVGSLVKAHFDSL